MSKALPIVSALMPVESDRKNTGTAGAIRREGFVMTKVSQTWSFGRGVGRDAPQGGAGCAVGLHRRRHLFTIGSVVPCERRCGT